MNTNRSSAADAATRTATIVAVKENLITIDVRGTPVMRNEVGVIVHGDERLMAEVLRITGDVADMQVFEDTTGIRVGDVVELSGAMLSVELGPGLLSTVFDGLQKPLAALAKTHGFFLPRGIDVPALDTERKWEFKATAHVGDRLTAGQPVGTVIEGRFTHKIMVPFTETEPVEIVWIADGTFTVDQIVAHAKRPDDTELDIGMRQVWPVRRSIPEKLLMRREVERLYPSQPLTTAQRIIDTFLPIARGGTACIPGPFGAGKTVLQSCIARYADVDIVVIIACGERAGEVVETIKEYPETVDPKTGGSLMDRTIIICNTSSMPVAARESSIYTGLTIAEYYRQMGFDVLCIADSTSRWAQAMRETSGRMEEIPGEEAFPAYLDSVIKVVYERAGVLRCPDGAIGSMTLIGTVSPAGGNFEEPVTQATLATVKTFLGLSADRAYKRFYPAIDPLTSWSRYLEQLEEWFGANMDKAWVQDVSCMRDLLLEGDSIYQTMQVAGEEGISDEDFVNWQKSVLLDMVYLQQDAFDPVDCATSRERQRDSFHVLLDLIRRDYDFKDKDAARSFFTRLTGLFKNWNYSAEGTPDYTRFLGEIRQLAAQGVVVGG